MNADLRLTIADVMNRPLFQHAVVVSGSGGLARPVRWVHVLETAENGHFLNGGELILSTGLGFGEAVEKRLAYLSELIQRKAAGLCIELGPYIPQIPTDMKELADHHHFPLIVFHQPVRFVDITLDLHEILVNRQTQALRKLEEYSRQLQQLSLQAQGISRLLHFFQASIQLQTFFFPFDGSPIYSPAMPQTVQDELNGLFQQIGSQTPELTLTESGSYPISDRKKLLYHPVAAMGHVFAYLGIVLYERDADDFLLLMLDYTATAMAQILMRSMFATERALESESQLLDDLLADRLKHEEQVRSLLGIRQQKNVPFYYAVIAEAMEQSPPHELVGVYRSILSRYGFRSLIRCRGNRFYLMIIEKHAQAAAREKLQKAMAEMKKITKQAVSGETEVIFGVSRSSDRYVEVYQHFQQAEQALIFQTKLPSAFFDDLGVYRLFFHLADDQVLTSFISDYLGPLIKLDKASGSQLLHTLRVYLDHNLSKQETAEHLYIHRQTLYHRLQKINECIGETFHNPDQRICYEIALRAYEWLGQAPES